MSKTYKTEGIIIGRKDLRGADRLVFAFTKDFGKIKFVAKGVKKIKSKLAGHLELFNYVKLVIARGKNLDIVTAAQNIEPFNLSEHSDEELQNLYLIAEAIDAIAVEEETQPELFKKLTKVFFQPSTSSHQPAISMQAAGCRLQALWFLAQLLNTYGYAPELQKCVASDKDLDPKNLCFSFGKGGLICGEEKVKDFGAMKISEDAAKLLRILFKEDFKKVKVKDSVLGEVKKLLVRFVEVVGETEIKSC